MAHIRLSLMTSPEKAKKLVRNRHRCWPDNGRDKTGNPIPGTGARGGGGTPPPPLGPRGREDTLLPEAGLPLPAAAAAARPIGPRGGVRAGAPRPHAPGPERERKGGGGSPRRPASPQIKKRPIRTRRARTRLNSVTRRMLLGKSRVCLRRRRKCGPNISLGRCHGSKRRDIRGSPGAMSAVWSIGRCAGPRSPAHCLSGLEAPPPPHAAAGAWARTGGSSPGR